MFHILSPHFWHKIQDLLKQKTNCHNITIHKMTESIESNKILEFNDDRVVIRLLTGSRPRSPLWYYSLVCINNYLFIIAIGKIADMYFSIYLFCLYIWLNTGISKINIRYTSVLNVFTISFIYNACCVLVHTQKNCMFCWYRYCFVY